MKFKRIELQGFKSFAEHVTIEFQDGITCVVGPNGSGKSNISDGIRWVLGEQSPKALRGGKMEEVIFSGTATRKAKGMAEVTLVIDNSDNALPIDYAEVAIRRRMYRSGESEYSINGNQCRLRDVKELIMDTGIGVDGYSIISQGKISEIVSSKPDSRRALFEEAAGIIKYRSKKVESERKLEVSRGNLDRVDDIIEELEARIGGLKDDSEKAKEYLILKDRYKELEINITLKNIENIQLKNEYIKDELMELAGEIDEIKEEKIEVDSSLLIGRSKNEELEEEGNKTRDRLLLNANEIYEIKNKAEINAEKRQNIDKDKTRLREELLSVEGKLERELKDRENFTENKEETDLKSEKINLELNEKISETAEKASAIAGMNQDIDDKKQSIYDFHRDKSFKESEVKSLISLRESLERRREQLLAETGDSLKLDEDLDGKLDSNKRQLGLLEDSLKFLRDNKEKAELKHFENKKNEENLIGSRESISLKYEKILARKKTIEEMESNYEGYNYGVKAIMKSGVSGIRGVVAELMDVPTGYEIALETALGAAMQNIICEEDSDAKEGIKYLKDHKAGRLTFLPVRSIRQNFNKRDRSYEDEKGFLGYGVEKVSFDANLKDVFEYLLGRVAIVDNIENAIKISKKNRGGLRFVTLDGDVINTGGAMTGGTYKNKSANLLERKGEIADLGQQLDLIEKEKQDLTKEIKSIQEEIEFNFNIIKDSDRELREKEHEKIGLDGLVLNQESQRNDINSRKKKWEDEIESISIEQGNANTMSEKIIVEIEELILNGKNAEEEIENLMEVHVTEKEKFELLSEKVTELKVALGNVQSEKENNDRIFHRIQAAINEIELDKKNKQEEQNKLLEEETNLDSGKEGEKDKVAEKEKEKVSLEQFLLEIQEIKAKTMRDIDEKTIEKIGLDEKLENKQSLKYETEIKEAKNDTLLDSLKNKLWDEFETSYIQAIEFKKNDFIMGTAVKESRDIKNRIKDLGEVNVGAIKEYESVNERYEFLSEQRADLIWAMEALERIIQDMDKTIRVNFKESFDKIVDNFNVSFKSLFGGGYGELRLEDENSPLECGIEINAQPPGKKLQNMNLLSGGEKTMTAIALMFAILKAKPTPFCILDEVEAALDDSNIIRFAEYLTNFKETQFTLVTHQKATMEYADALYGVTMPEQGISKVISLKLGDSETKEFSQQL